MERPLFLFCHGSNESSQEATFISPASTQPTTSQLKAAKAPSGGNWRGLFDCFKLASRYGEAIGIQTKETQPCAKPERSPGRRSVGTAAVAQIGALDRFAVQSAAVPG